MAFPETGVLDTFVRSDGGLGASWSAVSGTLGIVSNTARGTTVGFNNAALWVGISAADEEAYITLTTSGGVTSLFLRLDGSFDGYLCEFDASLSTASVYRLDAGVPTLLGSAISQAVASGDAVGASIIGSTITLYHKPSAGSWTALGTRSDSTHSAAGSIGFNTYSNTNHHNDFGGGEYTPPATGNRRRRLLLAA